MQLGGGKKTEVDFACESEYWGFFCADLLGSNSGLTVRS